MANAHSVLHLLKYLNTEGLSRACPVCGSPMEHLTDGFDALNKCLQCGFSAKPTGDIGEQHKYQHTVTIVTAFLQKNGYFELYQPLDEKLFNTLISAGKDAKTAMNEVIRDLNLTGDALEYFKTKIEFLGVL